MANANYNYSLNIGATIGSTDNIKTQLDAFANKYKMKIEVKLSDMKLDQLNRNLGNATTAMNDLRKATSAAGQDMKGINANASQLNRTLTTTATDVRSVSTGIENLTRVTESSSSVINTNLDRVGDNVVDVERAVRTIDERFENLGRNGLNNLNRLNQGTQNLERTTISFGNVLHRVFEFYVASLPIRVFETAVRETIEVIKDFDSALTEFKKVSDLSGESLNQYTEELGELGLTVARTRSEMTEMAGNFKKAGFSEEEAKQLSVVASMYQNVADSEISAGDAANYVTSQIKAFHLQAEDAQNIIDQLNIVSNNFAVSSTDISTALTKTASAMATLGNDMSQTIGLTTVVNRSIKTNRIAGNS